MPSTNHEPDVASHKSLKSNRSAFKPVGKKRSDATGSRKEVTSGGNVGVTY